ncbi:MurR/RpiR family transcriptional regulator [Microbacterium sp. gxy059]|uniref:MurR/RpiR family transcriptional regulator n=1 Tax=Microbacterium sp. gxy059 TaxID=2957199 RepID=UPI003D97204C
MTELPDRAAMSARTVRIDIRIDEQYGALAPQERRVADFLLEHLGDLSVMPAADISRETGVSKATVSRFIRKLGFEDYKEAREHALELRRSGLPTAGPARSANTEDSTALQRHVASDQENLARMSTDLTGTRIEAAVDLLAHARSIRVFGLRNSYPLALHLRQQLIQVREGVRLIPQPGQTLGEELAGLTAEDVVVAFGFRRRPAAFGQVIDVLAESPAKLICVGDSSARRFAMLTDCWIECPLGTDSAFDSYAAPMSLVSLLSNGVLSTIPAQGSRRISSITSGYEQLGELEL